MELKRWKAKNLSKSQQLVADRGAVKDSRHMVPFGDYNPFTVGWKQL